MGIAILSGVLDSLVTPSLITRPFSQASYDSTPSTPLDIESSKPSKFIACVNREETAKSLRKTLKGVASGKGGEVEVVWNDNTRSVEKSDVILLCCKPQIAQSILSSDPNMTKALENKLVISILAGTTLSQLNSWVPNSTRVVRAMPNTPCKVREGMIVLSSLPPSPTAPLTRSILLSLFQPIGLCTFLDEKHFDACTALSACGPAFLSIILEAMTDGGVMMGLPRGEALVLAAQAMQGTSKMVLSSGLHPAQLKDSVTTPGGCTIAGLLTLEDGRVRSTIARCIQTATVHASGLGQGVMGNGLIKKEE